jgi:hypothetical protein
LKDKLTILALVKFCANPANHGSVEGQTTEEFLLHFGFSKTLVNSFFRPFFGGVFLEEELVTTASKFVTLFSYFSRGLAALPKEGMQALPEQMVTGLPSDRIHLSNQVKGWEKGRLQTDSLKVRAKTVILANWPAQHLLLDRPLPATHRAITLAFAAPSAGKHASAYLKLNGSPQGSVQTVAFNSRAQSSYAPSDRDLVMVSCRRETSPGEAIEELIGWFGPGVKEWEHLKTDLVTGALPVEFRTPGPPQSDERNGFRIELCGDHTETGSIQGALASGRKAALRALGR